MNTRTEEACLKGGGNAHASCRGDMTCYGPLWAEGEDGLRKKKQRGSRWKVT